MVRLRFAGASGGGGVQGVGVEVAPDRDVQLPAGVGGVGEGAAGRGPGVAACQHVPQHLERLARGPAAGPGEGGMRRVVPVVAGGGEVQVVAVPAAGERDVELLAGFVSGEHGVGGVDGGALGEVDGGGVAELQVFGDVVRGQREAAAAGVPDGQAAVAVHGEDGEPVAVLYPLAAADGQVAVVVPGEHGVAGRGGGAVAQPDLRRRRRLLR